VPHDGAEIPDGLSDVRSCVLKKMELFESGMAEQGSLAMPWRGSDTNGIRKRGNNS